MRDFYDEAYRLFLKMTRRRKLKHGYSIRCRKGLWAVKAPSEREAAILAMHYFIQRLSAGEYGLIIPKDNFLSRRYLFCSEEE